MQYTNILVPYDDSEQSQRALQAAIDLSTGVGHHVKITVLHVTYFTDVDDPSFDVAARMAGAPVLDADTKKEVRKNLLESYENDIKEKIEKFFESLPDNVDLKIDVKDGKPQSLIVEYADDNDIDCIVMGSRGLGAITAALGSVSTYVLRTSDLPVLVIR